jgi:hypothetical protein
VPILWEGPAGRYEAANASCAILLGRRRESWNATILFFPFEKRGYLGREFIGTECKDGAGRKDSK